MFFFMAKKVAEEGSNFFPSICSEECLYNPQKDNVPVDQVGFVNLRDAYVNSVIPGDLSVDVSEFNGVDEPGSLLGRSHDVFEAIRKGQSVQKSAAAAEAAAASSAETE